MTTSTPTHAASNTTAAPMSGASTGAAGHGTPLATFTALLRREFWENRGGLWTSQLWTTGILLVLIALSLLIGETFRVNLVGDVDVASLADLAGSQVQGTQLAELRRGLGIGLWSLGVLNQIVLYFVVLFYCISALYDERKDRSILFWKSLPATDTQTVLSKLVTAVLVAPVLALAAIAILHLGTLLLLSLYASFHGLNPWPVLWQPGLLLDVWLRTLATIPVHMLWALPGIAWLLLASSWAKRAPFVWAVLLPILAAVLASMLETLIRLRLPGSWVWEHVVGRIVSSPGMMSLQPWRWQQASDNPFMEPVTWGQLRQTLVSIETGIGLLVAVALLAAAIWLRRYRDDS